MTVDLRRPRWPSIASRRPTTRLRTASVPACSAGRRTTRFSRWLRPGCRVLEIGCGTGARHRVSRARTACASSPAIRRRRWSSRTLRRLASAGVGDRVGVCRAGCRSCAFLDALDHARGLRRHRLELRRAQLRASPRAAGRAGAPGTAARRRGDARPDGPHVRWETLYFTARGDARLGAPPAPARRVAVPVAGVDVPTFYHRTADVRAALGDASSRSMASIGIGVVGAAAVPRTAVAAAAACRCAALAAASIALHRRRGRRSIGSAITCCCAFVKSG